MGRAIDDKIRQEQEKEQKIPGGIMKWFKPYEVLMAVLLVFLAGCGGEAKTSAREESPMPTLEVFATGANISGANGIHFGPDGLLYVASVIGSDLTVLDPASGEVVKKYTAGDGVIGPDDVAFAPDGSYYWTSILTGEVAGFDTDGNKIIAAQLAPGPNPITFSDDGRLFVSQCFLGTNLYELDPKGVIEPRLIADNLGPGCGLNGMDWGPDNRLYGPRWFVGEVVSFDVDSGERRVEASGFETPAAVKFDSNGVLHVLDTGSGEVLRVVDGENEVVATIEPGLDNFTFDQDDTLFVSSFVHGYVKRVNKDGSLTTLQPGGMAHPAGITVVGDLVWVSDIHAIRGFNRNTGEEAITQTNIVGVSDLGGSINISGGDESLILTSWFDGDVRIWEPNSMRRVAHYPELAGPASAVRFQDGVAVAEHTKGSVTLYGEGGARVIADGFPAPTGLVAAEGGLYLSDRELGQIIQLASGGDTSAEPMVVVEGLESPEGFVVTETGYVVVEAAASRVLYVSDEDDRRVLAEFPAGSPGGAGLPPSQLFNGIAIDQDNNLFLTGEAERVLYRIAAPW